MTNNNQFTVCCNIYFYLFQICIELASDSRDFSAALAKTKLAEMSGQAKIVPLPKPPPPPSRPPVTPGQPHSATNTQDPVLHISQVQRETGNIHVEYKPTMNEVTMKFCQASALQENS